MRTLVILMLALVLVVFSSLPCIGQEARENETKTPEEAPSAPKVKAQRGTGRHRAKKQAEKALKKQQQGSTKESQEVGETEDE